MKLLGLYITQQHDKNAWMLGREGGAERYFMSSVRNRLNIFGQDCKQRFGKKVTYRHCTIITVPCSQRGEVHVTLS